MSIFCHALTTIAKIIKNILNFSIILGHFFYGRLLKFSEILNWLYLIIRF